MTAGDVVGPFRSSNGFNILKTAEFRVPKYEVELVTEYHSRHILVRTNELTSDEDAKIKLEQLKERIENGESFESIAKANSDDNSAIKGGDLDWMALNVAVPEFEEIMIKSPIGQITQPFKTRFGWHILEVIETRQVNQTDKIRKANARAQIAKRKSEEAKKEYLRRLRDEAFIDLRLDDLR